MTNFKKVALIAGGGPLPHAVLAGAQASGIEVYVASLDGFSAQEDFQTKGGHFRLGDLGKLIKTLRRENVEAVSFAGIVKRPDFKALRPDAGALKYLPGVIKAATDGDDALLRFVTGIFEKENIKVIGPQMLCQSLLAEEGVLTSGKLSDDDMEDAQKAREIAKAIGALDIGQGAIVAAGLILAVEAQEGTDAMLARVASLPSDLKSETGRLGVLAKMVKPGQEDRVDMPTIGLDTVSGAREAGLAGIAVEAGRAFIMDKDAVIDAANAGGLFIIGLEPKA